MENLTLRQKIFLTITLILIGVYYFVNSCYLNCTNDGSHFALVSSIVNKHTVCVNDYVNYTGKIDYCVKDGRFFSDRLPGNAFLMIPFFEFGILLDKIPFSISNHKPIQEVTVILLPNICGVLGVLLVFLFSRYFNNSYKKSLLIAIVYALCTLNLQESTHVFSHAPSMLFVLLAFWCLISARNIYSKHFYFFVAFLSYSTIVELQNILLFLPAIFYCYQTKKIDISLVSKNLKTLVYSSCIFLSCISILLIYNFIAFNEITLKSNKYNPLFPEELSFISSLSGNFLQGLDTLLINIRNPELWFNYKIGVQNSIPGLLIVSPILFLSLLGFRDFYKNYKYEACLFIFIIILNFSIAASHKTVLTRHVFTVTPFIFIPIIFLINSIISKKRYSLTIFFSITFFILMCFSAIRVFYVTNTYYGRELNNLFPFLKEIPVYILFLGLVLVIYLLFYLLNKFKNRITYI
ncbi:MAG: hypothetical protein HY062_11730 [Bacteroidetes bacterium]|nr:hypothetical protein [Bacteroidota bacterium]